MVKGLPFLEGQSRHFEKIEEDDHQIITTRTRVTTRVIDPPRERVVNPLDYSSQDYNLGEN